MEEDADTSNCGADPSNGTIIGRMTLQRIKAQVEPCLLGHVRMYREDLVDIAKALAEVGPLTGSCGDVRFNDPADFEQMEGRLPKKLPELTMASEAPKRPDQPEPSKVEVVLSREVARVTLTEPVTLTLGVRDRIQQVAERSRRPVVRWLAPSGRNWMTANLKYVAVAFVVFYVMSYPAIAANVVNNFWAVFSSSGQHVSGAVTRAVILVIGVAIAVFLLAFGLSRLPTTPSGAVVINVPRASSPSWWERKKDDIPIAVGSLIVGGVIGYFVNMFTNGSGG